MNLYTPSADIELLQHKIGSRNFFQILLHIIHLVSVSPMRKAFRNFYHNTSKLSLVTQDIYLVKKIFSALYKKTAAAAEANPQQATVFFIFLPYANISTAACWQ